MLEQTADHDGRSLAVLGTPPRLPIRSLAIDAAVGVDEDVSVTEDA